MFGIGGIIAIPVLALVFDMDQQLAQGGDIASARASTPASTLAGSAILSGSMAAHFAAHHLDARNLTFCFAGLLFVLAGCLACRLIRGTGPPKAAREANWRAPQPTECVPMVDRPAKCRQIPRLKNIPSRDQAMLARFPEIPDRYRRLSSFDLSKRLVALGERNSSDFTFRSVGAACSLWDQSPSCCSPLLRILSPTTTQRPCHAQGC